MKLACALVSAAALRSADAIVASGSDGDCCERLSNCAQLEVVQHTSVLEKLTALDVECEEMCKRLGVYPDGCQCPGDMRKCVAQYCQDPKTPCPNDAFVTCVDEGTKIAALQWNVLTKRVDKTLAAFTAMTRKVRAKGQEEACAAQDSSNREEVRDRMRALDVQCEEMCMRLGAYPDGCQCPGFQGNPASSGDLRKCEEQYCQDPSTPCPNDAFVTCVDESTKIAAIQWKTLFEQIDKTLVGFKTAFGSRAKSAQGKN